MKVLIVEDDKNFSESLALEFHDEGHETLIIDNLNNMENLDFLPTHAVVDLRVGTDSGLDFISEIKKLNNECDIVMLTGFGSIATAVEAVKRGALEYLTKPVSFNDLYNVLMGNKKEAVEELEQNPISLALKEREYIEYTLNQCDGNISKAAKLLGLHRQSLQRKLKKYPPNK